jgi:hypothetical protein
MLEESWGGRYFPIARWSESLLLNYEQVKELVRQQREERLWLWREQAQQVQEARWANTYGAWSIASGAVCVIAGIIAIIYMAHLAVINMEHAANAIATLL